ncbi:MAG: prenyltransferase/squalene oxidase repeat-containing protein, partial [Candidatus Bathyarchaeia archaeon]
MPEKSLPLKSSPIPTLLSCGGKAIEYFTRRDLLNEKVKPITHVWQLPEATRILRKQQSNGSWSHSGKKTVTYPKNHHELVETWKNLRILVERYEFTKEHEAARKAAEYLFSFQTEDGDIRGMLANQYATYYTGAMLAFFIKAGYAGDVRVEKGLDWLLQMRQNDGGWSVPILTYTLSRATINKITGTYAEPLEPDRA